MGVLTLSIAARWIVSTHPPIFGTFENSIAAAWCVGLAALLLDSGFRGLPRSLLKYTAPWAPVALVFGAFFERDPFPLTISERSLLVDIHVLFAWGAHTVLLAASSVAIVVLFGRAEEFEGYADDIMFRGAGVGFALLTLMIAVGSAYSFLLFADWFRWELVETFAAATWLAYGLVLHAAMMFRWRGKPLAWAILAVLPLTIGLFWTWSIYSGTYHHFEIPLFRAE